MDTPQLDYSDMVMAQMAQRLEEAALLSKVEMLERELEAATKLAADRLEQMNADRKAHLDLHARLTDAENFLRIVASTRCATPDLQTGARNYFRKKGTTG